MNGVDIDGAYGVYSSTSNGRSNPTMPNPFYGVKIDQFTGTATSWDVIFRSYKAPVWGSFYSKDGNAPYNGELLSAWNAGLKFDSEAIRNAAFGTRIWNDWSYSSKYITVPDTTGPAVPELPAQLLAMIGLVVPAASALKRKCS